MKISRLIFILLNFLLPVLIITGCTSGPYSSSSPNKPGEITYPAETAASTAAVQIIPLSPGMVTPSSIQPPIITNTPPIIPSTPAAVESPSVPIPSPIPSAAPIITPSPEILPTPGISENATSNDSSEGLIKLQSLKTLKVKTAGFRTYISSPYGFQIITPTPFNFASEISTENMPVTWNGTAFSGFWSIDTSFFDPDPLKQYDPIRFGQATVTGIVSEDGSNLISLEYNYEEHKFPLTFKNGQYFRYISKPTSGYPSLIIKFQLQNVPLKYLFNEIGVEEPGQIQPNHPLNFIGFESSGSQIQKYFVSLDYLENITADPYKYGRKSLSTDWTATGALAPTLSIIFSP
jgi:hypothetical protein